MKQQQGKQEQTGKAIGTDQDHEIWSIAGVYRHPIYSPKGGIEGFMLDADGVPAQFVFGHGPDGSVALGTLVPGQRITVEGAEARPWPQGEGAHAVYAFKRLAAIDGKQAQPGGAPVHVRGKVVRMNYARHGAANGVLLDSGDFVHVRPDRFSTLGIALGSEVAAHGPARDLADGSGRVIDAVEFNGEPVDQKP